MGSFNLGCKSKFGGLMFGLYGAWSNTHLYLLSKSVGHNLLQVWAVIVMQKEWPIPEQVRSIFVHFSAQCLHPITIIRCWHTCFTWNSICHDDSSVTISNIICLTFDSACRNFLGREEDGLLHSFDYDFNSGLKSRTHVSSIAAIRQQTSCNALWISVGLLLRKISILM